MFQKISSCFINQMFYVRIIIIMMIIIIIFNFNITFILIIIIILINKSTIFIPIILSFVLHFFDIRNSCVIFIFEFICVFLTTCFLWFIGFRCNISLKNFFIDLLLLALVFLKSVSSSNKQISKFIMCYNFNCRLVLDLYVLFPSFKAVLITQNLDSNFKYQLLCIVACMIITTLNRFLNLKWFINLSLFIFFKLANLPIKNYRKSSWVLPISKYDWVKFFSCLVFIKFLVPFFITKFY